MACLQDLADAFGRSWLYLLPFVPSVLRAALVIKYRTFMKEKLSNEEQQRSQHRSLILALAGFSFTTSLALPAYGVSAKVDVLIPTFYVVLSFLFYLAALNIQGYKFRRWHDQLASGFVDTATFCLLLTVMGMAILLPFPTPVILVLAAVATLVWSFDIVARFRIWSSYFNGRIEHD